MKVSVSQDIFRGLDNWGPDEGIGDCGAWNVSGGCMKTMCSRGELVQFDVLPDICWHRCYGADIQMPAWHTVHHPVILHKHLLATVFSCPVCHIYSVFDLYDGRCVGLKVATNNSMSTIQIENTMLRMSSLPYTISSEASVNRIEM